mmetsp:Transcript_8431/g.11012  ORF Transcript_8431/g.11012 Transcript_8431/m.11012 type:complete len:481 (-) Transcript_8431:551-1993(-)
MHSTDDTLREGLLPNETAQLRSSTNGEVVVGQSNSSTENLISELDWKKTALVTIGICGGAIYGYNVSVGATIEALGNEFLLSSESKELVSASATISDAATMAFVGLFLIDKLGRFSTLTLGSILSVIGGLLFCNATNLSSLVLARFAQGSGNGIAMLCVPMLLSEISAAEERGFVVSTFQLGVTSGFSLPYLFQISFQNWRITSLLGVIPGFMVVLTLFLSRKSICWSALAYRPNSFQSDSVTDIEEGGETFVSGDEFSLNREDSNTNTTNNTNKHSFRMLCLLAVVLAFTNNSTDTAIFYGPTIVKMTGIGEKGSLWTAFALSLLSLPANFLVLCIIHLFSRRYLFLGGLTGVCISYFLISTAFVFNIIGKEYIVAFGFLLMNFSFAIGPGTLFVVILSELLINPETRAKGMAVGTVSMSIFSIICNGSALSIIDAIGPGKSFFMYFIAYVLCLLFLAMYLPETRGVKFEISTQQHGVT